MTIAENEAAVWQTFIDAGWTVAAVWKGNTCQALFEQPGVFTPTGAISTEYAVKYQAADMPTLKEGDQISVAGAKFRVRETPLVSSSHTGFFKRAALTKP
jgi:hypothetical protein